MNYFRQQHLKEPIHFNCADSSIIYAIGGVNSEGIAPLKLGYDACAVAIFISEVPVHVKSQSSVSEAIQRRSGRGPTGRYLNQHKDDDNVRGRHGEDCTCSGPQGPSERVDTGGVDGEPNHFVDQHRKGPQGGDGRR